MPQSKKETKTQAQQAKKRKISEVANNQTVLVETKSSMSPRLMKQSARSSKNDSLPQDGSAPAKSANQKVTKKGQTSAKGRRDTGPTIEEQPNSVEIEAERIVEEVQMKWAEG